MALALNSASRSRAKRSDTGRAGSRARVFSRSRSCRRAWIRASRPGQGRGLVRVQGLVQGLHLGRGRERAGAPVHVRQGGGRLAGLADSPLGKGLGLAGQGGWPPHPRMRAGPRPAARAGRVEPCWACWPGMGDGHLGGGRGRGQEQRQGQCRGQGQARNPGRHQGPGPGGKGRALGVGHTGSRKGCVHGHRFNTSGPGIAQGAGRAAADWRNATLGPGAVRRVPGQLVQGVGAGPGARP